MASVETFQQKSMYVNCSICGEFLTLHGEHVFEHGQNFNFCPNCGTPTKKNCKYKTTSGKTHTVNGDGLILNAKASWDLLLTKWQNGKYYLMLTEKNAIFEKFSCFEIPDDIEIPKNIAIEFVAENCPPSGQIKKWRWDKVIWN